MLDGHLLLLACIEMTIVLVAVFFVTLPKVNQNIVELRLESKLLAENMFSCLVIVVLKHVGAIQLT